MNTSSESNVVSSLPGELCPLDTSCVQLQSRQNKLGVLAENPFVVLGEARVVGNDIVLMVLGDVPPEPRLGLAAGSFPKTIAAALAMLHPDDRQLFQKVLEHSLATGEPFDMNYRLADGQGGWRWIEGRAVRVEVREGKNVGWVFTNRDITKHKQLAAQLETTAQDWQTTFDTIQDLVLILDTQHRVVRANAASARFFGLQLEQVEGSFCHGLTHATGCPIDGCPCRQAVQTRQPAETEIFHQQSGRWFLVSTYPLLNDAGAVFRVVHVAKDITQRKQGEMALRQAQGEVESSRAEAEAEHNRLWKLAANAFSLLGEAHLTETGMALSYFGDGAPESKIGLKPGTQPRSIEELVAMIHPADLEPYQRAVEHAVATGEPFRIIYRLSDGWGGWRWLQARAISLEEREGKHVRWLHDTIDITERKETEEALRQSLEELRQLKARLQNENLILREEMDRGAKHRDIIGSSAPLQRVLEQVELVSATNSTVLISGETGTGKELIARAVHQRSSRRNRLFVAVNCAALPASLVESELFGHERGAFTGAIARRAGRFEQADGGALFLDEISELPLETQAKLLRVIQFGEFERVGGNRPLKTNVRIIAASNRDLADAVREGRFRSDLYHRLSVFPMHIPPLRERREDIPLLAAYLVTQKARQLGRNIERIAQPILDQLMAYDWPGNVRELENVLERAIILSRGSTIDTPAIQLGQTSTTTRTHHAHIEAAVEHGEDDTLETYERTHILRVCESTGWKIKGPGGAASKLGLNPGTLYSRMKKLSIQRPGRR